MTDKRVSELLLRNLPAIYGWAFSRLYDKEKVEDLASEIVCEILASAGNLRSEDAFWGFAWRIAKNTFRKFLRRETLRQQVEQAASEELPGTFGYPGQTAAVYGISPEQEFFEREAADENVFLLRRELSLLTKIRREVCVAYYIDNKSCSLIAEEQNISVEMVKYHLFRTRKLLKEGIGMTRQLGEKSYNPGTFRLGFWGDRNRYKNLLERRLPGAILLAAYEVPVSAEELSVELGVAMPYLEEEIEILEAVDVLVRKGGKYQTNLVIITEAYEKEFVENTSSVYKETAERIFKKAMGILSRIRQIGFADEKYDENRILFAILNMSMVKGYEMADKKSPVGLPRDLAFGSKGWIFGYDNNYVYHHFNGVTMRSENKEKTAWFSAENYRAIEKCQLLSHMDFENMIEAVCDAILENPPDKSNPVLPGLIEEGIIVSEDGALAARFPVFDQDVFEEICRLLTPVSEAVSDCMISISSQAEKMLAGYTPSALRAVCGDIAKIHHRLDVSAFLMEELIAAGRLTVPEEKTPLCIWGVRM